MLMRRRRREDRRRGGLLAVAAFAEAAFFVFGVRCCVAIIALAVLRSPGTWRLGVCRRHIVCLIAEVEEDQLGVSAFAVIMVLISAHRIRAGETRIAAWCDWTCCDVREKARTELTANAGAKPKRSQASPRAGERALAIVDVNEMRFWIGGRCRGRHEKPAERVVHAGSREIKIWSTNGEGTTMTVLRSSIPGLRQMRNMFRGGIQRR